MSAILWADSAVPTMCPIVERTQEVSDVVTIVVEIPNHVTQPQPGQFMMLWSFGIGEVPISVSRIDGARIHHTIRAVGRTTEALCAASVGDAIGLRGPFGTAWPGADDGSETHLIVGGGLGIAPLRPAIDAALATSGVEPIVIVGARSPDQILYREELTSLSDQGVQIELSVDSATHDWSGHVGLVTKLLDVIELDHRSTTALMCGPEIMMRAVAFALSHRRLSNEKMWLSLERNMHCALAHCGRCQLGPKLLCRDGPILRADVAEPLLQVRGR